MLAKTKWYVNRLKKMSFLEVIHRCYEQLVFSRIKLLFKLGILPSFYKENNTVKKLGKANFSHLDDYFYDGLNNESLDDIYTCLNETETILFTNVNYRIADDNFDIRNFWEKHRFQQLVSLSRNGSISKAELVGFVKEWSERNPPYIGKNYVSVMEVALRVISLLVANYYIDRFDEIKSNSKDDTFLSNFVATLPAITWMLLYCALIRFTASITPAEWPCAVSTTTTSTPASISASERS